MRVESGRFFDTPINDPSSGLGAEAGELAITAVRLSPNIAARSLIIAPWSYAASSCACS